MHIAQAATRLSGKDYQPGDVVPDDDATFNLVSLGILIKVPDATVDEISGTYEPGDHTVGEVISYLERNPDRAGEVYVQEKGGKDRVTILRHIDEEYPDRIDELGSESAPTPEPKAAKKAATPQSERERLAPATGPADDRVASSPSATQTPKVGEPARGATSKDITDDQLTTMRESAGTDPANEPNPSAPVPPKKGRR